MGDPATYFSPASTWTTFDRNYWYWAVRTQGRYILTVKLYDPYTNEVFVVRTDTYTK